LGLFLAWNNEYFDSYQFLGPIVELQFDSALLKGQADWHVGVTGWRDQDLDGPKHSKEESLEHAKGFV
jgi:hypothetical protein